jgi:hypothetical protein
MLIRMGMEWRVFLLGSILFWIGSFPISAPAQTGLRFPHNSLALTTRWDDVVSATNVHPEYPRPTMERTDWLNLNGLWDCAITQRDQTNTTPYTNQILVPFPVESKLSGIKHLFTEQQRLWYRRTFIIPKAWQKERVSLHFEAVDWEAKVWVNGQELGTHQGGYDRFSFDITGVLKPEGEQEVAVSVLNPIDSGFQPRGKQMLHPRPPFFSASSGIWQTVWLEPVPATSIESLKLVPDIDAGVLNVIVRGSGQTNDIMVEAEALDGDKPVAHAKAAMGAEFQLAIPKAKLWSPDNPFLYDLKLTLTHKGEKVDSVTSYFGMRKISVAKDANGFPQLMLNNQSLFELGTLDQGYWPDGIYTAPTDEALRYDIEAMKQLGFNMCRKHVKIEPERWYYWCDKLGLLVWQDMPNGDRPATPQQKEIKRQPESALYFENDLKQMILQHQNHPCIVMWIPFNQGWGQYDTTRITDLVKDLDPSRLVAGVSGWHDMGGGDVRSLHQYPGPASPEHDGKRVCVIGECGGLGLKIPEHMWGGFTLWNTRYFNTAEELAGAYRGLITNLNTLRDKDGLAGAVITQWTDVEKELNGFMTYDRAIIKMPVDTVRRLNERLMKPQDMEPSATETETNTIITGQK